MVIGELLRLICIEPDFGLTEESFVFCSYIPWGRCSDSDPNVFSRDAPFATAQ